MIDETLQIGSQRVPGKQMKKILQDGLVDFDISSITGISGPYDGKINSIYQFKNKNPDETIMFRARVSEAFRYEQIVKEKILFPILDRSIKLKGNPQLENQIDKLVKKQRGKHLFKEGNQPIIAVQDLLHYDETREDIPYIFSLMSFIPGISLYEYIASNINAQDDGKQQFPPDVEKKVKQGLEQSEEGLGRLHTIQFPAFYARITDIGKRGKEIQWNELFSKRVDDLIVEAAQHKNIKDILPNLKNYFANAIEQIPRDEIPVLFHNDFQPQNFIIDETTGDINGYIDFDNWQIGPREQDFIKIQYWMLESMEPSFEKAFMKGYSRYHSLEPDFQSKVDLYKMAWFVLVFNFEMDKMLKNEQNVTVDNRFPSADKYIQEIKTILEKEK